MDQFSFIPMEIKEDVMIVYEPYGSMIIESLCGNLTLKHKDYISLSLEKIEEKEKFIEEIALKIRGIQRDLIGEFLAKKSLNYL